MKNINTIYVVQSYILQMLPLCFFNRTGRVFNVFVNNPIYPCAKNIRYIRAITSLWSVNQKDMIREIREIRVQKTSSAW